MKIALVMPPSIDFEKSFCFLQFFVKEVFSRHEVSAWLLETEGGKEACLPWLGTAEKLFYRQGETLIFPQQALPWLCKMYENEKPDLILVYGNIFGHQLAAMLAQAIGCDCFSDATEIQFAKSIGISKNVCSSNAVWKKDIRQTPFVAAIADEKLVPTKQIQRCYPTLKSFKEERHCPSFESQLLEKVEGNPLETAKTVFIGGRGLGSMEAADKLRRLAKNMGAEVGFSRPAAMNGWGSMSDVVGQSGLRIAPELCLVFGVSGSAAFLSGISGAREVVAINTDPDAPIFKAADKGLVADLNEILDYLLSLSSNKDKI